MCASSCVRRWRAFSPAARPCAARCDRRVRTEARGVDDQVLLLPGLVVPVGHLLPCRQDQPVDGRLPLFHPAAVLRRVRADDLDVDQGGAAALRHGLPRPAGEGDRIDAVGDHRAAEPQVRLGQRHRGMVARRADIARQHAGIADRLLDHVDAKIGGGRPFGERAGDGRLSGSGQPAKDNQRRHADRPCVTGSGSCRRWRCRA